MRPPSPTATSTGVSTALSSIHHRLHPSPPTPLPLLLHSALDTLTTLLRASLRCTTAPSRTALLLGPPSSGKTLLLTHALHTLSQTDSLTPLLLTLPLRTLPTPIALFRSLATQLSPNAAPSTLPECHASITASIASHRASATPLLLVLRDLHVLASRPEAQPLLYALLNLLQDRALPAACVATTPHFDLDDALEKRVRSRFAPVHIVLPLPATPAHLLDHLAAATPAPDLSSMDDDDHPDDRRVDAAAHHVLAVAHALARDDGMHRLVQRYLRRSRIPGPVVCAFHDALVAAFHHELVDGADDPHDSQLEDVSYRVSAARRAVEERLFPVDPLETAMLALSVVELALLAALAKAERVGAGDVSFESVLEVYGTLKGGEDGLLAGDDGEAVGSVEVARKCWERLVEVGLVAREGTGPRSGRAVALNVEASEVESVVQRHRLASTRLKRWARAEARR